MINAGRRRVQPRHITPIARDLPFTPYAVYNAGAGMFDIGPYGHGLFSSSPGSGVDKANHAGRGRQFNGTTEFSSLIFRNALTAYPLILAGVASWDTAATNKVAFALSDLTASGPYMMALRDDVGGAVGYYVRSVTGGSGVQILGPTWNVGANVMNIALRWISSTGHSLFVNGSKYTTSSPVDNPMVATFSRLTMAAVERSGGGVLPGHPTVSQLWCANQYIDDEWLLDWSVNPWKILADAPRYARIASGAANNQPPRSMHQFRMRRAA